MRYVGIGPCVRGVGDAEGGVYVAVLISYPIR